MTPFPAKYSISKHHQAIVIRRRSPQEKHFPIIFSSGNDDINDVQLSKSQDVYRRISNSDINRYAKRSIKEHVRMFGTTQPDI